MEQPLIHGYVWIALIAGIAIGLPVIGAIEHAIRSRARRKQQAWDELMLRLMVRNTSGGGVKGPPNQPPADGDAP